MLVNILKFQNYAHENLIYNSRIILNKIVTCYSQNYAGILGSGLIVMENYVYIISYIVITTFLCIIMLNIFIDISINNIKEWFS